MKFTIGLFVTLCATTLLLAQSVDIGSPPGRLVDIGGRKIHMICTGSGSPTVILEAGASSFAIDWTLVQSEIARTNRVCSYDRAGMGWSDPTLGGARDNVIGNLHTALKVAQEKPPYIMVGASMGGIYVRLFEDQYPNEVVGMVLVDPASEDRLFLFFEGKPVDVAAPIANMGDTCDGSALEPVSDT